MKMPELLNTEKLNRLRCSTCNCYLSIGPVTIARDGFNCGRCPAGSEHAISIYDVVAATCLFPCRYNESGCTALLEFGGPTQEHEDNCEYRQSCCPFAGLCNWQGIVKDGFQHCVVKHKENVFLDTNSCEMSLEGVVNQRKIVKLKSDRVVILHVIYGEKTGLSVFGETFYRKSKGDNSNYNLMIKSSNGSSYFVIKDVKVMDDSNKQSKQFIPNSIINSISNPKINFEFQTRGEKFDMTDMNAAVKKLSSYKLLRSYDGFYACCNATHGCNFMGTLDELIKHEEECNLTCCFVKDCKFLCMGNNLVDHLVGRHSVSGTEIVISYSGLLNDNWYFLYHKCYLFFILAKIDETCMCVIKVNYTNTEQNIEHNSKSVAVNLNTTDMVGSTFDVIIGNNLQYKRPLLKLKDNFRMDCSNTMYIPQSVIEQNGSIKIKICLPNPRPVLLPETLSLSNEGEIAPFPLPPTGGSSQNDRRYI